MPNRRAMYEVYLAALQIGVYLTPINHHLVGPEIAYIVEDSDAKVLVGHERFADALSPRPSEIEPPRRALLRRRRRSRGSARSPS